MNTSESGNKAQTGAGADPVISAESAEIAAQIERMLDRYEAWQEENEKRLEDTAGASE